MKRENMGVRDTINTRGSDLGGSKFKVEWGNPGISTGDPISNEQAQRLLAYVEKRAAEGNCFHMHTFPAETRFITRTLSNAYIHMFAENFDDTGKDWLIIAADEATAKREANRI